LGNYPVFTSTITQLEYLNKMIGKYTREGKEDVVKELDKLKKIFEMETA
jgi:hypothetical protein